jgi:hypothetical protein
LAERTLTRSQLKAGGHLCDRCFKHACRLEGWSEAPEVDEGAEQAADGIPVGVAHSESESSYPEGYLDDPQGWREKLKAEDAKASMDEAEAGMLAEEMLSQDIEPADVAATEQELIETPEFEEEFADWALDEVLLSDSDSSSEEVQEGGYMDGEPRLEPTQEPEGGWPSNTSQGIRIAAAAAADPEGKRASDEAQELLEEMQLKYMCATCGKEVPVEADLHYCQTCQVTQCKDCTATHWLDVDNSVCPQYVSWGMIQWAKTTLQLRMQKYQYGKVASEIAASGIENRRQHRAEATNVADKFQNLFKAYDGSRTCHFAQESGAGTCHAPCLEPVVCCEVCEAQPLCKRCFKQHDRRPAAGHMMCCSVCRGYCHKACGSLPAGEKDYAYGHKNFKCPKCEKVQPKVIPPWRSSTASSSKVTPPWRSSTASSSRGQGSRREGRKGMENDEEWAQRIYDEE